MTTRDESDTERHCDTALILVDVINDLDYEDNRELLTLLPAMAERLAALKEALSARGIPSIYVNDNFSRWRSDFKQLLSHVIKDDTPGAPLARALKPGDQDYFVLKPMHSGFYSTPLDLLLQDLGVKNLVLTGIAGNICVLFTANDAYMRGYKLYVAGDCVLSDTEEENRAALAQMRKVLKAQVIASAELPFRLSAL